MDAPPAPRILDLEARFLWPFAFDPARIADPLRALSGVAVAGNANAWTAPEEIPRDYLEELPAPVADAWFGREHGCLYRRLDLAAAQRVFEKKEARWRTRRMAFSAAGQGIEVFLARHGVGVLSITLAPREESLPLLRAIEWQYRLAQTREVTVPLLHRPHPSEDAAAWQAIPPEKKALVAAPPPEGAPLSVRLVAPGGSFRLRELVDHLLAPLLPRPTQEEFSVYSVVRLDESADLGVPRVFADLSPFLAGLAQIEEPGHAGALPGEVPVPHAILNRRHAVAVSSLGAAHLVSDQPGDHPFNPQRVPRVRDKYFVPHLSACLQRQTLLDLLRRASEALVAPPEDVAAALSDARRRLLSFGVVGRVEVASHRTAIQRAYEVSLDGLRVRESWEAARRSIGEIDEELSHRAQHDLLQAQRQELAGSKESLDRLVALQKELVHLQHQVHLIEIFLITVYSAHLAEMVWHPGGEGHFAWHVLAAAAVGLAGGWWFVVGRGRRKGRGGGPSTGLGAGGG